MGIIDMQYEQKEADERVAKEWEEAEESMVFNNEVTTNSTMTEEAAMLMNISGNRSRKTHFVD